MLVKMKIRDFAELLVLFSIIAQYSEGLEIQIPQFMQRKYSNQFKGSTMQISGMGRPTASSFPLNTFQYGQTSGRKTAGVKSAKSNTKTSKTNSPYNTACATQPLKPPNVKLLCSKLSLTCQATCESPQYLFPNGETQLTLHCDYGQWKIQGINWFNIPPCEPICSPPCQNNGICMAPNQCDCPGNFSGPQCQFQNLPCLNYPPMPINAQRSCNSKQCTITCSDGHEFPDGSAITTMVCKNGHWVPVKEKWVAIPDCEAICNPPCQNGGKCMSFNVCQCPTAFRGQQCQFGVEECNVKKLPTNGGYNCSGNSESFSCSISCPENVPFEFQPEPVYTCLYSQGIFLPTPIPKCVYSNNLGMKALSHSFPSHFIPHYDLSSLNTSNPPPNPSAVPDFSIFKQGPPNYYDVPELSGNNIDIIPLSVQTENQFVTVQQKLPEPGSCFHWGGSHYKTFDGEVYSFESKCSHVLARDAEDNTFSIITQNHDDCYSNPLHCHTVIKIYLQGKQYFLQRSLEGVPLFRTVNKILPIPGQVPGIRVEMSAHHIVVLLDAVGASIRWDGQQLVHVEVKESLWNRTEGLCGRINGDAKDDLLTTDGYRPKSIVALALNWKVDDLENICDDVPSEEHVCQDTGVKDTLANKATLFCSKLLNDVRFSACQHVVDITSLLDACRWDFCNCNGNDKSLCACETLNVYVRDCSLKGITGLVNWRDADTCPMQCTGGKIYKACGPAKGQPGCGAATELPEDNEPCVEGCYCPEGTVVHENKCLVREKCPCRLRGRSFPAGTSVPKDCNTCTCDRGQWICTEVSCGSRCSAIGDPHYATFDGKKFDFMGQCSYYLVKNDNFSIEAENVACAGAISQAMNFPASVAIGLPSCTKTVTIKIGGQIIKLKQNHDVLVNGQDISKLPFSIAGINIRSISSIFLQANLPNGIEVLWDGLTRVYIDLPAKFKEKTRGLCGTFNNNQKDDFLTPEDDVEQAVIPFANKWKTDEKCRDIPEIVTSHPCDKNMHKKPAAKVYCSRIKSDLFKDCHWFVDPDQFYQDCMYDMCSCELQVSKCLCPIVASYAYECSRKGVKIDWRGEVRECGVHCPGGQTYQVCGNSCTRTCYDIANNPDCKQQCVEGCNCPEGQTLDDNGECIPIGQCNCQYDGLEFPAGYKEVRPATHGPELCSCVNAVWQCRLATPDEMNDFPRASDLRSKCNASNNQEFTTCEPAEPLTCKNMHSPEYFSASVCHPGCQCKDGYVLETSTQNCVKPTECPCHHGGRSYKENSVVQNDCNTCTCQNGKWTCSDRQCSAECTSWGDSHYKTFDGKFFDYQGQCDYVLAKGNLESNSFDISIQNVPCGSLGTACSKSVTVKVTAGDDTESITLYKDKPTPSYKTYKHVIVRNKGMFVILEALELGLVVHWDKGTRVYVRVDPRWKNRIKGLCGNYNDNDADDFQTPSGGIPEVSANIFGDSWRLQSYCPEAVEIVDTCQDRPDRKIWALKKCGVLKSPLFASCHSEVPINHFYEKCIFDSCACDQGGDCECLCTALAAYAQECNNRGVPIKWRSQKLCPMQCDERCSKYNPCVSTCPIETCDNSLVNSKLSKTCGEDTCIEGCEPKPCPVGFIYSNSSYLDCIPRNICKPLCLEENGKTYFEGDLMEEDECHSCYCSREEKICKGSPCTTLKPEVFTTHQMEEIAKCKSGWTNWINQDKEGVVKATQGKQNDVEPLPTELLMNNLKESAKCDIGQMLNIECRTVGSHIPAKDTGLDVECSLQKGLVCKAGPAGVCPDFEIRVLCQCEEKVRFGEELLPVVNLHRVTELSEETTTPSYTSLEPETKAPSVPVEPDVARCPPGTVFSSCAIECNRLCHYYSHLVKDKGHCQGEQECESGCVSKEKLQSCPNDTLWANDHECVLADECLCADAEHQPIKPGRTYEEGCRKCQCIENSINCYDGECETQTVTVRSSTVGIPPTVPTMPPVLIPPKTTPPPKCDEDRFMDLIQGDQPLPDDAFNASSVLNSFFSPSNARFNSPSSEISGGSWAPEYSNEDQYLQIDLGKQEPVYGVILRGSPMYNEFVTSYRVLYSPDGDTFYYILNEENYPVIFRGSVDPTIPVKQVFATPVEAKVVRINPQTWNNAISLRVELIGCGEETTTAVPVTHPSGAQGALPLEQFCDDPMGLSDGKMGSHQISTSSDLSPEHSKINLKLNGTSSWQPLTNSATEWIEFDFLEPRNITGLITKGGENGWVTAFTVKYSQNRKDWNPVLNEDQEENVFPGNYDNNMPIVSQFTIPINTRYVRITPTNWKNSIQMRVELMGCFKPYPIVEVSTTVSPSLCNNCPGVESPPLEMDACRCLPNLWWDGENCVNRTSCPCMVGHIPYAVGAHFVQDDCSECTCKLGGVSHCAPKKCEPCKEGLRSTVTSTCACTCQPCPPNTVLCPTSNICINETWWCNGIQDCPDDELNCPTFTTETLTTTVATTTTRPEKKCPIVQCHSGYKKIERKPSKNWLNHAYLSAMISGQIKSRKTYTGLNNTVKAKKNGNKGSNQPNLQKPLTVVSELAKEPVLCKEYKCVSTKPPPKFTYGPFECPPPVCQSDYVPVFEETEDTKSKVCPVHACYPPEQRDAVCNVTGRTFNTFDGVEYKYDICNHVLARDLENNEWTVSLRKNCSTFCSRDLVIWHQDHLFVMHPNLSVEFDGYKYSVEQTKSIGSQNKAFSISQLGNGLLFISNRYAFWVFWNSLEDVKLGVVHKLVDKVDGLCGFFNDKSEDDKRKPNGNPARTSVEFGDSWAIAEDQPLKCEAKTCPSDIQNKAWEMCNKVKEQPLSACARVLDIEAFISRCLETTCSCLEHSLDNHTAEEECRCHAMQNFVIDCLSADSTVDLSDWRMQQDCPTTCEPPLVYHDCYQRKCEPTCQSISDPNVCTKINNICFPGCYCPPGYVRKGETCIKPSDCRDCECNVLPHLQYVTYDENNFTINGNCTYVLSRDIILHEQDAHKFQVLVTNEPCKNKGDKTCVEKITVLYDGHTVNVLLDEYMNKLQLIADGKRITDFNKISQWIAARETATKHIKLLLTAIQVEVSVYYPSLGVSVKAPSHKYGGRLEGLCGDCNGDLGDDIKSPLGSKSKDINDFALSWLYETPPGHQSSQQCENKRPEDCPPLPVDSDPCVQLVDINKFGQCLNVLDPSLFIEWCRKDTCGGHPDLACASIEAYARDCANAGFCINWRNEYCPAKSCPPEQFYDPCGTSTPETCDSIKGLLKTPKKIIPTEGCYCPEGKVFLNDTCVTPNDCEVCDEEGHHPGDKWQKDKCTSCTCEGTSLKCETQQCSGASTICESGYKSIKISASEDECCDKYACVLEPTVGPTCETPSQPTCGSGQVMKLITKANGCQTFICECKPIEDCEPVNITTDVPLEPGYVKEIYNSGCCPVANLVCKKDLCPEPKDCPEYYSLKLDNIEGKCCPFYSCEPPKEKCIYETEFTAAEKGGKRPLTKYEKQNLLKAVNETWKDGPCRECKCTNDSLGSYRPVCKETNCPSLTTHADFAEYQLEAEPVFDECCPRIKRSACKYDGKVYNVSETWSKGTDFCTTYKCAQTATGIQRETEVKSCDKKCEVGSEYVEPTVESEECCGSCKQVACVVDGEVYQVDEDWVSPDFCTNYFCVNLNGSLQVQSVVVNCPKLPADYLNDFVIDTLPVEGDCCPQLIQTACKVGDTVYKIGETWPSPDGDKCKTVTCFEKENKELAKRESIETCKKECAKGWEYQESNETCCGECVQVACLSDGNIVEPGKSWKSPDNCTTFYCDDQFIVSGSEESCPSLQGCPAEDIYQDGCCKRCNLTAAAQTICSPEPVQLEATVGLINYTLMAHGECVNKEPIANFTECVGKCHSSTFFNKKSGLHESVCYCCQATDYTSIYVELICADGEKRSKKIAVPSKCGCESCAANQGKRAGVKSAKSARHV